MEQMDELSFTFFKLFSRMEYALKAASFNNGDGNANANWTAFAGHIDAAFQALDDSSLKEAIEYILKNPPKKQVIKDGLINWSSVEPSHQNTTDLLILYIRRVRNNLFHGGKFNEHWFDPERSEELISSSICVLESALPLSQDVQDAYDG
ncbi:hypothetical protein GCM10011369_24110 [Neiella marina]|uniref:Uncharacterized protein n=1 Tax=Neiella marina TaxID=508461 RepID=A0A8J2U6D7_9GAMM|nr:hypothetical protein [Neiella marina]GGA81331.1 hypothetical protein GCM10011369_24110 [Neiella marina]